MSNAFDGLDDVIDNFSSDKQDFQPYFYFEGFDCEEPDARTIAMAAEDGVSLYDDDVAKLAGEYPRPFQNGAILSTSPIGVLLAGSQVGKSVTNEVLLGCMVSRQPPYAYRYEEGVDTGIVRQVNPVNIRRFGRIDIATGTIIDHDETATPNDSWNCGNIIGLGIFPEELYCESGRQIWIGSLARSIDTYWWLRLTGTGKDRFLPESFLDQTKGNKGSNYSKKQIHFLNDIDVFIKSYDGNYKTFESVTAHAIFWDEEPLDPKQYSSGASHSDYMRFSFTALNGISFTKSLFFGCISEADKDRGRRLGIGSLNQDEFGFFQASSYDSPYQDPIKRDRNRRTMEPYRRKIVTWGRYAESTGTAFFARSKIEKWQRKFLHGHRKIILKPEMAYDGMYGRKLYGTKGLLDIDVIQEKVQEDDLRNVWRIYENPIEGTAYMFVVDSAAGAVDPMESQDFNFGTMFRLPNHTDPVEHADHPVIVATIRSTLPTIAFANYTALGLRLYNNAVLAAERGHGKDNEAYGVTLDDYPYWYYRQAQNDSTKKFSMRKGFDTHVGTRNTMLSQVREWLDDFEESEDPYIRDSWLYDELAGAILSKKKRCDHSKDGFLDGVITLAIGTFIFNESPEVFVCNVEPEAKKKKKTLMTELLKKQSAAQTSKPKMGAGIGRTI